ncbi:MAG: hypothetical protein CL685_03745 [Candidatus Magasanikbacteria bacterium]|nr:hypothetical protein [Candidatus Magasanikbacteria bacterium]|tara:strand:+ start:2036 stop:2554 length:519 start_codon:yes stop_codon:yes gene_type:complete
MTKKVGLVIASKGFQPVEYGTPKQLLEDAGFLVVTISDATGEAVTKDGSVAQVDMVLQDVDPKEFDGIFVIGGPGALDHLDNQETNRIVNEMMVLKKPYGAICISPRILAKAHVLIGKKATGWNKDGELETIFPQNNVTYAPEPVVIDGNIVTADGPSSAEAFGKAIISVLQ